MAEDKPLIAGEQAPTPFATAGAVGPECRPRDHPRSHLPSGGRTDRSNNRMGRRRMRQRRTRHAGMIADLTRRALKWAKKISEWTEKITSIFQKLFNKLGRFGDALKKVKKFLEKPFTLGQSPLGTSTTIKRAESGNINSIKMDGDIPIATGNKVVGAGRLEPAEAVQGDTFPTPTNLDSTKQRPTGNRDHYE